MPTLTVACSKCRKSHVIAFQGKEPPEVTLCPDCLFKPEGLPGTMVVECQACFNVYTKFVTLNPIEGEPCPSCHHKKLKWVNPGMIGESADPLKRARDTIKRADEFMKILEARTDIPAPGIKYHDIYLGLNHLFNAASKQAFEFEVDSIHPKRKIKVIISTQTETQDEVKFFGAKVTGERNIFDAAKHVANTVNEMAKEGYVTGVLKGCKLIVLDLVREPHELAKFYVLSYPALSQYGVEALKTKKFQTYFEPDSGEPELHIK